MIENFRVIHSHNYVYTVVLKKYEETDNVLNFLYYVDDLRLSFECHLYVKTWWICGELSRTEKAAEFVRNKIGRRDCLRVISMKNRFWFYRENEKESVTSLGKSSSSVCKSLCHVDSIMILSRAK